METQLEVVPARKSIYSIQSDYLQLMQKIEDADGELSEDLSEALAITEKELTKKAVNYTYIIKEFRDKAEKAKQEIDRITKIKVKAEKDADRLEATISEAMLRFGIERIDSDFITLYHKLSEQLIITDVANVPDEFKKQTTGFTVDKAGLKKAIKMGDEFEGIFIQEKKNLQIK